MNEARVGVVVVAYKPSETIGASIHACLQDPAVSEVIVVDNSRDAATQVIVEQATCREPSPACSAMKPSNALLKGRTRDLSSLVK